MYILDGTKKKILFFIVSCLLIFASSFIFLYNIRRGGIFFNWLFFASIGVNVLYYFWLLLQKIYSRIYIVLYIPVTCFLFLFFVVSIGNQFWLVKRVAFDMGPDPFVPGTNISSMVSIPVWENEFWSESARERFRLEQIKKMQTTRQGSLIGHVGVSLQGWTDKKIRFAFGEPAEIVQVDKNLERWIYHPWTNHPEWEMPVYVQNNVLLKIGD